MTRGKKAENYRLLESLKAYVFISQTDPHIELYELHGDGFWFLTERKGFDQELPINSLGISLSLREIYDRLTFVQEV
jgi:Uma2 family endonuclease